MSQYPSLYMVIDGEQVSGGGRRTFAIVNPATGETIGDLPLAEPADLDRALDVAKRGFALWRDTPAADRARVLTDAARLLEQRKEEIARIATLEEGKTLAETRGEVAFIASLFTFQAGECQRLYGRTLVRPAGMRSILTWEPVGVVAAFAPWNFPIGNVGRKLAGPIAAGCSVILKAAEETPASALAVIQCLYDAGLPKEVAQAVFGVPDEVSRHLLTSPIVRKLSFTGSTAVGKQLVKLAADNMLPTTMELGGHGPVLVFDDADIERALDNAYAAKIRNAGQVCVSPTRFIVQEGVFEQFRDGMAKRMAATRVGDGFDDATQMGPMANPRRPDAMERLIGNARAKGARLDAGGERIGNRGFFYAPTALSEIPLDADIMNEEPFGPVALINPFASEEEMIAEANRLPYGLAAYAWTESGRRGRRVSREVESGIVGINTHVIGAVDSPFGGIKWSGHGKEDGMEGVLAYMVQKAIHEA